MRDAAQEYTDNPRAPMGPDDQQVGMPPAVFYLYGYTLNRVTLFALIFSIGILVDDAIVIVENIARHYRLPQNHDRPIVDVAVEAVDEVGNPTILATFAVIAAIIPMAFVRGLMGPYMRPIPVGASAAMIFSLLVAFVVTPWASVRLLKRDHRLSHEEESWTTRFYRRVMALLLHKRFLRYGFLAGVVCLLLAASSLVALKLVRVKMLPFDNKSEFQVIIDMPEGSKDSPDCREEKSTWTGLRQRSSPSVWSIWMKTEGLSPRAYGISARRL